MNHSSFSSYSLLEKKRPRTHFIGVCGKAMGPIAAALKRDGWDVSGSDENCYEPMNGYLQKSGIGISSPYDVSNLPDDAELFVVGKRVVTENVELQNVIQNGRPFLSFPAFLQQRFLKHSRNAVIAGGAGKTTTTSMLAWILEHQGYQPDYLIGGMAKNFEVPARLAGATFTVMEGDEYASCFDDSRPKFLHYNPEVALITNVLEDHPDLYKGMDALEKVFAELVKTLPAHGLLILPDDDDAALRLANSAPCEVAITGFSEQATFRVTDLQLPPDRSLFRLANVSFELPFCGRMNVRNAAMAALAAAHFGVSYEQSAESLALFKGVGNRQETKQTSRCILVTDKASHPKALQELFQSLRQRFPDRRLISVIQPRATGGRKWVYQQFLPDALTHVDKVLLTGSYEHNPQPKQVWEGGAFSLELLHSDLAARNVAVNVVSQEQLPCAIHEEVQQGDVVIVSLPEQSLALLAAIEKELQ